ncbi:hypothetical protein [Salinarimonas ramus]|uniref:PufQ cytochrome subunit n=1 Tax=Salinarimonas ramus TaxID=690164 RepID=A0A917QFM1_9HYPH|nr:hypothetical protein [Salinarimonas ramus]GGK46679.1 hypothetical protein GCM10011322_37190 [Salinarimonas ramus]
MTTMDTFDVATSDGAPISARRAVLAARKGDALEYRLILAGIIPFFLVLEVASRLVPRRRAASETKPGSVWEEAKAAACRAVPLAFMG